MGCGQIYFLSLTGIMFMSDDPICIQFDYTWSVLEGNFAFLIFC